MKNLLRNLAYASVIIAATTVTIHELSKPVSASILGCVVSATYAVVLTSDGKMIELDYPHGWSDIGYPPIPISPSQVAYVLRPQAFVDTNGNGWMYSGSQWVNIGPPPCDMPINVEPTTWSGVKARTKP